MERRDILKTGLAALSLAAFPKMIYAQNQNGMIKPKALKEGDTVAIVAPATAVTDPDDIQKAIQILEYFNLKYKIADSLQSKYGYKSRTIEDRVKDIHSAFTDDDISAVFCIRGGYGSGQILDKLDYKLIKNNPKIFIGYSDITALHLAINKYSNLVTFHGPVLLSSFSSFTIDYYKKAIFETEPIGIIQNPDTLSGLRPRYPVRTIKSGTAEGKLIGGNLTLVTSMMGTKYEIETKDRILFLEDVGEEPYRIDRMLNQLALSGKLKEAKGIVFGKCVSCDFSSLDSSRVWDSTLGEILDHYLGALDIPSFYGLLIGHSSEQATLPLGLNTVLDAENCNISINESACI